MTISQLLEKNEKWANDTVETAPNYFSELSQGQSPNFLWIGCSDSRVCPDTLGGVELGTFFVHRNIANQVLSNDLSMLSTLHYAIQVLGVEHIILCGHYGCGGVDAAFHDKPAGVVSNWITNIQDTKRAHSDELKNYDSEGAKINRLCELNVLQQKKNLMMTTVYKSAMAANLDVKIHPWIFALNTGKILTLEP